MNDNHLIIGFDAKRIVRNGTGLGSYGRTLVNSLAAAADNDYRLYVPDLGRDELRLQVCEQPHVHFVEPAKRFFPPLKGLQKSLWRSRGIVNDLVRDGVQLFHGLSGELPVGLRRHGIRSVVTIHDLIFMRYPQFYNPLDVFIYKRKFYSAVRQADRIVAISECTKHDILNFSDVAEDKIDVIYQSCDTRFKARVDEETKRMVAQKYHLPARFVLNVGTIEERKNVLLAVKALLQLPDEHLVIVGKETKYAQKVRQFVDHHRLSDRVHFLCGVPNDDLFAIYQLAAAFVYPSRYEGFGIPVIEAIQSGLPVVAATGSCLEEAGGPDCLYVDPDDERALAQAIRQLLNEDDERDERLRANSAYISRFENADVAQRMLDEYEDVLRADAGRI